MKQFIKITEPDGTVYAIRSYKIDHISIGETALKIKTEDGTFFTACKWNNDLSLILKDLEID